MMSYECFEKIMESLQEYWENMCKLEDSLGTEFNDNWLTNHFDYIAEALIDEFEGTEDEDIDPKIGPIIYYYAFDLDWGNKGNIIPHKGVNYTVNGSYLLKIDTKNLLVIDIDLSSYLKDKTIYLKDMILDIENYRITNTSKYCDKLSDIGVCYNQNTY